MNTRLLLLTITDMNRSRSEMPRASRVPDERSRIAAFGRLVSSKLHSYQSFVSVSLPT